MLNPDLCQFYSFNGDNYCLIFDRCDAVDPNNFPQYVTQDMQCSNAVTPPPVTGDSKNLSFFFSL